MKQITIRVEDSDLVALARIASDKRTTVAQLIREAMARFIESNTEQER